MHFIHLTYPTPQLSPAGFYWMCTALKSKHCKSETVQKYNGDMGEYYLGGEGVSNILEASKHEVFQKDLSHFDTDQFC